MWVHGKWGRRQCKTDGLPFSNLQTRLFIRNQHVSFRIELGLPCNSGESLLENPEELVGWRRVEMRPRLVETDEHNGHLSFYLKTGTFSSGIEKQVCFNHIQGSRDVCVLAKEEWIEWT